MKLCGYEKKRYARHISLPQIGMRGQIRLKNSSVAVIGAGGLGSSALLYLAAAGIGRIKVIDSEKVDVSNFQRQVIYSEWMRGRPKAGYVVERIGELNRRVRTESFFGKLDKDNADALLRGYDVILDCLDNFTGRDIVNSFCVKTGTPLVHGSVYRFEGHLSVFCMKGGPCYRCLYPYLPKSDVPAGAGIMGALPGVIGSMQALETVKILTGSGKVFSGRVLTYDSLEGSFDIFDLKNRSDCGVCGRRSGK